MEMENKLSSWTASHSISPPSEININADFHWVVLLYLGDEE